MYLLESDLMVGPNLSLATVVWCLYIGAVLGWAGVLFNRLVPGSIARKILKKELFAEEQAQSPQELGVSPLLARLFLRDGSTLRRIVRRAGETDEPEPKKGEKKPKLPVLASRFYIPEELKYRADIRYTAKLTDILALIVGAALLLGAAFLLYNFIIPWLLGLRF